VVSRRIIYQIEDSEGNRLTEDEWDEVERLQHWYNSEFSWSTGRLAFKRFVSFPNTEDFDNLSSSIWDIIAQRHQVLHEQGLSEREIVSQMEKDRLLVVKWGGYYDNCLASGFTRVADNEWNAYLVCDFLLKASTLCLGARISVRDEGKFIKTGSIVLQNANVSIPREGFSAEFEIQDVRKTGRVFSVVDAEKYNRHPAFRNIIPEFNKLKRSERMKLVRNWNWLGYDGNYDVNGDDKKGFDLNSKVRSFNVGAMG
jgi:hypothetical protein